jgi:hypothetical protein
MVVADVGKKGVDIHLLRAVKDAYNFLCMFRDLFRIHFLPEPRQRGESLEPKNGKLFWSVLIYIYIVLRTYNTIVDIKEV